MTKREILSAFIDRINAHDVDSIRALMDEGHVFIDGLGHSVKGPEAMRQAWKSYFAMMPDYWIKVDRVFEDGDALAVFGAAGGTVAKDGRLDPANRWEIPAAWLAVVGPTGIVRWQVFADTGRVRHILGRTK
jgi:ketosteroid isomerase-like protein